MFPEKLTGWRKDGSAVGIVRDRIRMGVYIRNYDRHKTPLSLGIKLLFKCTGSDQNLPISVFT